ncbi:glycosyltransferase family 9 protein [Microcoleus sp. N3A4]|uniref:glycosyltransferase family 9 protein n=1 Tax=Microcoleus sp. N3A4 TaxID=3055379 RepID=UPI002FCF563E
MKDLPFFLHNRNGLIKHIRKRDVVDPKFYRNNDFEILFLLKKLLNDNTLFKKYYFLAFNYFNLLEPFDQFPERYKIELSKNLIRFNRRYLAEDCNSYVNMNQYCRILRDRLANQIENVFIEEAQLAARVYPSSFYLRSPLVKGINLSQEVVIILNDQIGDSLLSIPLIYALANYIKYQNFQKSIKVVAKNSLLLETLLNKSTNNVEFYRYELTEIGRENNNFLAFPKKRRFIINIHRSFSQYYYLGLLPKKHESNPLFVMSLDWRLLLKDEMPVSYFITKKYSSLPAMLARNFEVMLGQKLFDTLDRSSSIIVDKNSLDRKKRIQIIKKYDLYNSELLIVISFGSSHYAKEYHPQKWKILIDLISKKYPNTHFICLREPQINSSVKTNFSEHYRKYDFLIENLIKENLKVTYLSDSLENISYILSISKLSITPDTGIGHLSGVLGVPNIMLFFAANPAMWMTPNTYHIVHPKARELFAKGWGLYQSLWDAGSEDYYYLDDKEYLIGASDICPTKIFQKVCKILG